MGYSPRRSRQALECQTQEAFQVLGLHSGKPDGAIVVTTKSTVQDGKDAMVILLPVKLQKNN